MPDPDQPAAPPAAPPVTVPKLAPDTFAASLDCFFVQSRPGHPVLMQLTLPNGHVAQCALEPAVAMGLSRMIEAAVHVMMGRPTSPAPANPAKLDS